MDWLAGFTEHAQGGFASSLLKVWALAHVVTGLLLARWAYPDCPPGGYATATLTAVVVAVADAEMLLRLSGHRGRLFDLREGGYALMWVGLAVAYAVSIGLFAYEWHDQRQAAASARERQAWQDDYHRQLQQIKSVPVPLRRP